MRLTLSSALRLSSPLTIAFVGSGGKSTAIFQLAHELSQQQASKESKSKSNEQLVVITTTTHFGTWQIPMTDRHLIAESANFIAELEVKPSRVCLISGPIQGDKIEGLDPALLNKLHVYCKRRGIYLLIEADGSRQRPIKAPAEHEPAIPTFANLIVCVTGLSGLNKLLNDESVHRPEVFSKLTRLQLNKTITSDALTRALLHPQGGLKNIPSGARQIAVLNQADTGHLRSTAQGMASSLLSAYDSVLVTSLNGNNFLSTEHTAPERSEGITIHAVHERIAGIILAAGESKRFGRLKQLLDWHGQPFVRVVTKIALAADLSPVIVVTGSDAGRVEAAVIDLPVTIVKNKDWKKGQSSSIHAGLVSLQSGNDTKPGLQNRRVTFERCGGAVFLLADQPQVPSTVIRGLVETHSRELSAIVAPLVKMERRANPVLFDQVTFPDLLELQGDIGGRALFRKYPIKYLPWHDDGLLLDVDVAEDYQRLIKNDSQ